MPDEQQTNADGLGAGALVAIFIAFVPLAFSEDFLAAAFEAARTEQPGWALIAADIGLLALILGLTLRLRRKPPWEVRGARFLAWWAGGAGLTLALDAAVVWALPDDPSLWTDLGTSLLYIVSLAILLAATVGASPLRILTSTGRSADRLAWERFRSALPLLLGTLGAYVASVLWVRELASGHVIRTLEEARADAALTGLTTGLTPAAEADALNGLCKGAIDQEYFAQLSQVIPLLLVAVGLEARFFFERLLEDPVQRAMTIVTVVILCVGEALAISALPEPNQGCGDVLYGWHEFAAFVVTLEACLVALVMVTWALVVPGSTPKATQET